MNPKHNNQLTSPWTDEASACAKRQWEAGVSATAIGRMLDLSRNAVIGRATRGKWVTPNAHRSHSYGQPAKPRGPRKYRKPPAPRPNGVDGALAGRMKARQRLPRFPKDDRKPINAEPTESRNMKLLDLGPDDCRYATSPDAAISHLFCGLAKVEGSPYCEAHTRLCYRPAGTKAQVPPPPTTLPHGKTRSEHSGSSA